MTTYPSALDTWTTKHNYIDVVNDVDVNNLQQAVGAIETTLGPMPQATQVLPAGTPVNYGSVASRLDALTQGLHVPVCSVQMTTGWLCPDSENTRPIFDKVLDPFGMYDGKCITLSAAGWWIITCRVRWEYFTVGWRLCWLGINDDDDDELCYDIRPGQFFAQEDCRHFWTWQGPVAAGTKFRLILKHNCGIGLTARFAEVNLCWLRDYPVPSQGVYGWPPVPPPWNVGGFFRGEYVVDNDDFFGGGTDIEAIGTR